MSLKDLELKGLYQSDKDDLLNDFYISVLSQSVSYKRIAGFFSSNALAIAAKGISKLIENGGKIQLIANVILSEKDQEAIKKAIEEKEANLIKEIESLDDALKKGHISLLAWMIKNNKLDMKIAVVPLGLEHKKKGILEDKEGNKISFSGSDNETVKGWLENDEEFHVFCSWIDGDTQRHLEPDIEAFNRLWNDEANYVYVFPISEAFKKGLVETAPKNDLEFKELSKVMTDELLKKNDEKIKKIEKKKEAGIELFPYQKEAIDKWFKNGCKGIFEMATGTGKTYVALGCLKELLEKNSLGITIIVCPYGHLITQWKHSMIKFGVKEEIIIADSSNTQWKNQLADSLIDIELHRKHKLIVITTYNTFSSDFLVDVFKDKKEKMLLIADEMHWAGAETFRKGLLDTYTYRIGLSATPSRYFDDAGSELIIEYFGGTIYDFDLKKAINTINPLSGKTFLTPYKYYPYFVELDAEGLEEYERLSKEIARRYAISKTRKEKDELLQRLSEKRQKIIVNCSAKYAAFEEIIEKIKQDLKYCLVYCSEKQLRTVQEILNNKLIINHTFTGKEGVVPEKDYGGTSQRDFILNKFGNKNPTYQVLVAMKCLDEGVDVPSARTAIILASSGNPKQYIQRRGRILRRAEDKEVATIYDILVVPTLQGKIPLETLELERKILEKELKRYEEFAKIAENYPEALNTIFPIKRKYELI